ncbi:MAG: NAD(P)H-hydrate dehydratase [Bacteroidetes bacterium]|nr:NAD(P)H-hydrate dehydratase [Bacteroidota bacterium]
MQILSPEQIRLWDKFTIENEPITSIDLMERAAMRCFEWLETNDYLPGSFSVFCGKGNNGGDGLALARMLSQKNCPVIVYILEFGVKGTEEFQANLARLHSSNVEIRFIQGEENFHPIPAADIIIDALFGCGLNRPVDTITGKLIEHINNSGNEIIAIDIPSGLYVDKSSKGNTIIKATHTLSFQCYKLAFLVAENEIYNGEIHILDIGLHPSYTPGKQNQFELADIDFIRAIYRPRKKFSHKGNFGHTLLVAGSYGKMGAALMSAKACLRSGAGLLTCHIPKCGYEILQGYLPEAMATVDEDENINTKIQEDISKYTTIGIGPGIGTDQKTKKLIGEIFTNYKSPVVLDADGLNILAEDENLLSRLIPYSILTPHPKEFERIFGKSENDFARLTLALQKASQHKCIIVLKGHRTLIALPEGKSYFNDSGNAGMAKGGSGDALTGIISGLLSQGYAPAEAAIFGVYLHGLSGDIAAQIFSEQAMLPSDLIDCLGKAYLSIENDN